MRSVGIMVLFPPVSQDMVGYRTYNPSYYQITENMSRCQTNIRFVKKEVRSADLALNLSKSSAI